MGCRFWNADKTHWTNKNGFFYHKRHKRVLVNVDGLSLLEHGWNRLNGFFLSQKTQKGFGGSWWVVSFWNTDETDWTDKKGFFFITKGTKGNWKFMGCRFWNAVEKDWTDKNGFFYHKRHKRVLVEVDGLSLLERG